MVSIRYLVRAGEAGGLTARSYLVIGGGIVGTASALRLRAAGFEVTLIDPGDARRAASFGNIGLIATELAEPLASPKTLRTFLPQLFSFGGPVAFRWNDIGLWMPWAARFVAASTKSRFGQGTLTLDTLLREAMGAWQRVFELAGTQSLVSPCGNYLVWMSDAAAKAGAASWKRAATGGATFREMTRDELAKLGGVIRTAPVAGLAFSGTGQVSEPQAVRDALRAAFTARGGTVINGSVVSIVTDDSGIGAMLSTGDRPQADSALIAAGAWSKSLMRTLNVDVPLIGERGYSVQSAEHSWPADMLPVIFEERAVVVNRFTSGLRASSIVEFSSPDAVPDPRKWARLEQHVTELGIPMSSTLDRWSGPRPTLPDYLPAIGRLESHPRVLYAFGHQHIGMTLAAVTAELIESLALWTPPRLNIAPFRVERFL